MNETTLQVMGCGDAFSSGGRFQTCFLVRAPSATFLIDCGASSLVALKKNQISTNEIDCIVITHFHGDHFGGLPFFLLDAALSERRTKPLTIISPPGCEPKLTQALQLYYPGLSDLTAKLELEFISYLSYETITTRSFTLKAFPVIHSKETLPHAVKIWIADKVISFSGDTEWTEELIEVSAGADLFICECNFFTTVVPGHMNYKTLAENKVRLYCKNILLTHFGEELIANQDKVELDCAEDGKVYGV